MLKYIVKFISPLIFLTSFWLFFYLQKGLWIFIVVSIINILIAAKIISKSYFWKHKLMWLNFILAYLSQMAFFIMSSSVGFRYYFAFILAILWGFIWFLLEKYFENIKLIYNKDYLAFNRFFYYISLWFLSTSIYAEIILLKTRFFSLKYTLSFLVLAAFLWAWDILRNDSNTRVYYVWLTAFLFAQIVIAVYLLPLDFYVAGTIVTLWFFFIIDKIMGQIKYLRLYLGLFFASIITLFISSIL